MPASPAKADSEISAKLLKHVGFSVGGQYENPVFRGFSMIYILPDASAHFHTMKLIEKPGKTGFFKQKPGKS